MASNLSPRRTIISGESRLIASAKPMIARPVDFAIPTPLFDKTSISMRSFIGSLSLVISLRLEPENELKCPPETNVRSSRSGCSLTFNIRLRKMP